MTNFQPQSGEPVTTIPAKRAGLSARALSLIVAVVLLGALGAGAFVVVPTLFTARQDIPKLLAGDTELYASINPNLSAIKGIQNIQDAYKGVTDQSSQPSKDFNQQTADALGVSFKDDVQPWLGTEMAVGVSGLQDLGQGGVAGATQATKNAHMVFVLATRNKGKSQAFLDKLRKKLSERGPLTDESYAGVSIAGRARPAGDQTMPVNALATVGQYVVLSSDAETLKGIVDRAKTPKNTLAENPHFQLTIGGLPKTAIGFVYLDGAPIAQAVQSAVQQQLGAGQPAQQQLQKNLQAITALQGIGTSISIVGQGIALDSDIKFDMTKLDAATKAQFKAAQGGVAPGVLGTISRRALLSLTGTLPPTLKATIMDAINAQPNGTEQLKALEEQFNLNLEHDILDWLQGDVALVLVPATKMSGLPTPVTGYLTLRTPELAKAKAGLKKVEVAVGKAGGDVAFSDTTAGGQAWRTLKTPGGETVLGYGFAGEDLMIGIGDAALSAAGTGRTDALVNDANFKAVQANLPAKNGGVWYLSVPQVVSTVAQVQGQTADQFYATAAGQGLKPIKGIGIAGVPSIDDNGLGQARVFMLIDNK